ncbi:TolC family protein [Helicobacter cappadocius]|uniref:TolC family protein n=1 Tax=Helicobacter cappadocius TaxID=3063998 RepID=A0AA90PKB0_9HELI|nr:MULTISPECIES: TolC family protein [unclassified Helicobacter]MDO7252925.1 TolC family protein [Helicobacter sp. faydin-H75]MDP2539085.1 TolC family protein [Helicobacter sp. faydin-H76]
MNFLRFAILIVFFTGCTSLIQKEEMISKTRIPKKFSNQDILESIVEQTYGKKPTLPQNTANFQNMDFVQTFFYIFSDTTLQKLINEALKNNTNVLTLTSKIAQARSSAKIQGADMIPKIGVNLGYNYSDGNYKKYQINFNQNTLNGSLTLSWEMDIFGRINSLRKASKEQYFAAQKDLCSAKVSLIADVANYYFTIRKLANAINIYQKLIENQEKIYQINEQKYHLKLIDITDLASLKTTLSTQKNTLLDLSYQLEQNKNALFVLLNSQNIDFDTTLTYEFEKPNFPNIKAMPSSVLLKRPDVQSAIHTLNAQIYTQSSKRAEFFPVLNISGNLGQILFSNNGIGDLIWQITGSLAMPLFNRTSIRENYKIQKENVKQAFYTLQNSINTAIGEIQNAISDADYSNQNLQNSIQSTQITQNALEATKLKYNYKLIDEIALLNYQNQYLNTQKTLNDSLYSNTEAMIMLYKSFGGMFVFEENKGNENAQH